MPSSSGVIGVRAGQAPSAVALAVAAACLLTLAIAAVVVRDVRHPRNAIAESVRYFPSGDVVKRLALEYDALAADVYWIRALQHYGGTRLSAGPKTYTLPRAALVDDRHARSTVQSRLPVRRDLSLRSAARWSRPARSGHSAARARYRGPPGAVALHAGHRLHLLLAPERLQARRRLVREEAPGSRTRRGGCGRWPPTRWRSAAIAAASRALWTALAESGDNDWLIKDARRRLQQLDALDAVDTLTTVVERYRAAGGARPYSWEALVRAGYLRAVPRDPAGTPFHLGPYAGDVAVADESPLQPMPVEPARKAAN